MKKYAGRERGYDYEGVENRTNREFKSEGVGSFDSNVKSHGKPLNCRTLHLCMMSIPV